MNFNLETLAFREANRQLNDAYVSASMPQLGRLACLKRTHDLPAELRLIIYEYMAQDDVLFIHPGRNDQAFTTTSTYISQIQHLHQQVFVEHSVVARKDAHQIETIVLDLDFSHVAEFLDRLPGKAMKTLPTQTNKSLRRFVIKLEITQAYDADSAPWLPVVEAIYRRRKWHRD